jgi:hypothetical protein
MRIELRYRWRIFRIHLTKHVKLVRVRIAGNLLKLVNEISPELMHEYDRAVREKGRVRF